MKCTRYLIVKQNDNYVFEPERRIGSQQQILLRPLILTKLNLSQRAKVPTLQKALLVYPDGRNSNRSIKMSSIICLWKKINVSNFNQPDEELDTLCKK